MLLLTVINRQLSPIFVFSFALTHTLTPHECLTLATANWNVQVSGGVIGYGIEVGDWAQVYMGYFTVRSLTPLN
jgi:hypothetical protein